MGRQIPKSESTERGTLDVGEFHPAVSSALRYYNSLPLDRLMQYQSAFSSCAIEGNRLAEVCGETLHRLLHDEPVSDRYLLGLVWELRYMEEDDAA